MNASKAMKREAITQNQAISVVTLFVLGSSVVLGISSQARQDAWMGILLGMAAILPMVYVYARLLKKFPGQNLFDICTVVFGKVFGKFVVVLFTLYALQLGALVMRNFSEFLQVRVFDQMPQTISLLALAVLCIWVCRRGVEDIGRWSVIVMPVVVTLIAIHTLLLAKDIHPSNLLPVGEYMGKVPADAFADFSFPFGETVLFLGLLNTLGKNGKPGKAWIIGILIGGLTLTVSLLRNMMALGVPSHQDKWFPSYDATSIIIVGTFVSRIENIVGANLLLCVFVKASACLMVAAKGCARLFNAEDYRPYAAPLGLLMAAFAATVYKSTMEMYGFLPPYPYYAFPFQVLLPLALCLAAEIRLAVKGGKEQGGAQPSPV